MTTFSGGGDNDVLVGGTGNDDFFGGGGDDLIDGQDGVDRVIYRCDPAGVTVDLTAGTATDGFGGTDTLRNLENITGSDFNDNLTGNAQANFFWAMAGNDLIDGRGGIDRVSYYDSPAGVTVSLTAGNATDGYGGTDTLHNIENIVGSFFSDILTGDAQGNSFWGMDGNDLIDGQGGSDLVSYCDAPGSVSVDLTTGSAKDGFGGVDSLYNIEFVNGSPYDDTVIGNSQDNRLWGQGGDDSLNGMGGYDYLVGGAGCDTAVFRGNRANYDLLENGSNRIVTDNVGLDGSDTLTSIERLQFADKNIAFDLTPDGNAGRAMEFIGAVAPGLLNNTSVRGLIISLFDQAHSMESLSQFALNLNLLPTNSNEALANAVYYNVLGGTTSPEMTNTLVGYIEDHGQAKFLATVAGLQLNVDLIGLQQTGLEYLI